MNFFKKLFGKETESNTDASSVKIDNPEVWVFKFMLLVTTETTGEVLSLNELKSELDNFTGFRNDLENELSNIHAFITEQHKKSIGNIDEWDLIWDTFLIQLKSFKFSETFTAVRDVVHILFLFKMDPFTNLVSENYAYRMGQFEKYMKISKSDLLEIIEEEKENSGYNIFLNNNHTKTTIDELENDDSFHITEEKNQKNKSSNIEIPHYLTKALDEYELTNSNCKIHFKNYAQKLEELIKKARIPAEDKEFIQKNINHGLHKNFDKIDLDGLLRITVKYVFALDMNFKGSFKATESEFLSHLKKYTLSKEKYLKVSSKVNEQKK
jgi:hypothetical protein